MADFVTIYCKAGHRLEVNWQEFNNKPIYNCPFCNKYISIYEFSRENTNQTKNLEGGGEDAPIVENEKGGKESGTLYRFDLLPPYALAEVAKILKDGADKYGELNWLKLTVDTNINHALEHIFRYIIGDTSEKEGDPKTHLRHATCRILFALDLLERENN